MVVEPIETNAVFHYYPGEMALAIGSIGCNLDCSFCQAWEYSKIKSVDDLNLKHFDTYTPEEIVEKAKNLGLKVISWTFNDPMSWFEFVLDTAKLAKKNNIRSLFKSNHFINEQPLRELAKYVDIFSISIKSIENEFYETYCSGSLEPVLNAAKTLKNLNKYIEISNLVIPTLNNSTEQISKLIDWVIDYLGPDTPLHFARFHPAYKLLDLPRTPLTDVIKARELAKNKGIKNVFIGNVFMDEGLNSYCNKCSNLLVSRMGGRIKIENKDFKRCDKCGTPHLIKFLKRPEKNEYPIKSTWDKNIQTRPNDYIIQYIWKEDIWSTHIQIINYSNEVQVLRICNFYTNNQNKAPTSIGVMKVAPNDKLRYTYNRINADHQKFVIYADKNLQVQIFENLDRAYYALNEWNK